MQRREPPGHDRDTRCGADRRETGTARSMFKKYLHVPRLESKNSWTREEAPESIVEQSRRTTPGARTPEGSHLVHGRIKSHELHTSVDHRRRRIDRFPHRGSTGRGGLPGDRGPRQPHSRAAAESRACDRLRQGDDIEGDIRDADLVQRAMDGIDIVFHEAAIRITHCAENPRLAHDVLATGTFNVLEAAVAANVKRVVSASSASIYGQAEEFPTNEQHHGYGNRTIYGATKSYSEGLLRSFYEMYGLNYVALRYFNVYGPRMDAFGVYTEVMIRWMERLAKGQPCLILGDGAQTMDFVFVTDIARANLRAANSSITDDVLNIASGTETSLTELATALVG